jgi:uncharacterized membrane protein
MNAIRTKRAQQEYSEALREDNLTVGQKLSVIVADVYGSWKFILIQTLLLALWVVINTMDGPPHWDDPPYQLLNFVLGCMSVYTGTILQMASNRQEASNRKLEEHEFATALNLKEELQLVKRRQEKIIKLLEEGGKTNANN